MKTRFALPFLRRCCAAMSREMSRGENRRAVLAFFLREFGGESQNRTGDTRIFRVMPLCGKRGRVARREAGSRGSPKPGPACTHGFPRKQRHPRPLCKPESCCMLLLPAGSCPLCVTGMSRETGATPGQRLLLKVYSTADAHCSIRLYFLCLPRVRPASPFLLRRSGYGRQAGRPRSAGHGTNEHTCQFLLDLTTDLGAGQPGSQRCCCCGPGTCTRRTSS